MEWTNGVREWSGGGGGCADEAKSGLTDGVTPLGLCRQKEVTEGEEGEEVKAEVEKRLRGGRRGERGRKEVPIDSSFPPPPSTAHREKCREETPEERGQWGQRSPSWGERTKGGRGEGQ